MEYTKSIAVPTLQQHMMKTYLWLSLGIGVSFTIAFLLAFSGIAGYLAYEMPFLICAIFPAQIGIVIFFIARLKKMKVNTAKVCFLLYATSLGVTLSYIVLFYELGNILVAFVGAFLLFVSLATIGYRTEKDLTALGTICFAGLISMILFSIIAFIFSISYDIVLFSFLGLLIFMGFTAYDAKRCKMLYLENIDNQEMLMKLSIYSAFDFYLDFINMFIRLLNIITRK